MSFLDNIRSKPQAVKIRIMWAVAVMVFILMLVVWVLAARMQKNVDKDTSLFKTIGQGINNVGKSLKK